VAVLSLRHKSSPAQGYGNRASLFLCTPHMSTDSFTVRRGTAADVDDILRIEHASLRGHARLFPKSVSDPAGFMLHEVSITRVNI